MNHLFCIIESLLLNDLFDFHNILQIKTGLPAKQNMSFLLTTKYGNMNLVPGLPEQFRGPFLHGSQQRHVQNEFGSVVLQEIQLEGITLSLFQLEFCRKMTVSAAVPAGIQSIFSAKGKALHKLDDLIKFELNASQFILFHKNNLSWKFEVPAMRPLHLIHTSYCSNIYKELVPAFPTLENFLEGDEYTISPHPFSANNLIRDTVHQILHAGYEPHKLPFYFRNKMSEYLFLLLEHASVELGNTILKPSHYEKEALYKVRDLIMSDVLQHHVISDLAKKVKMNQYRLKYFFKREFGVGPYKFLLHARMEKAKQLIEQGKPMKEAVSLAGYTTTSFITAFRKRYGYTPGSVKRRSGRIL